MKNLVYLMERKPDYESPLEDFEKERSRIQAQGFPKYVYINPRFTVLSDDFTMRLLDVVQQCQSEWIKSIDEVLGCHNRRCRDFLTGYGETTKKARFLSWSVIRVGVYFLKGKQVNGNAWHRFRPKHDASARVVRYQIAADCCRSNSSPCDYLDKHDDFSLGFHHSQPHERCSGESNCSLSRVQFDFFPEIEVCDAGTDDFYNLLLSDEFDFEQYRPDAGQTANQSMLRS